MNIAELFGKPLSKSVNNRKPIKTGILVLDNLLGGGIINKGINIISGAPGVGKTQLILKIAENAYKDGYEIIYLDTELAIHESRFIYIDKKLQDFIIPAALTLEELDEHITKLQNYLIKQQKPILLIIDSISAMTTAKKIDLSLEKESALGLEAKLLTNIMHKLMKLVSTYDLTVLATTHLKQNIQMPMLSTAFQITYKGYRIPGGQALQYITSQLIVLIQKGKKELKDITLYNIDVSVLKNRLAPSGLEATLIYSPEFGYSNLLSSVKYLEDNNLITVSQGRYKFPFNEKSMLLKDIISEYKNNKDFAKKLDDFIIQNIQTKIDTIINNNGKLDDIIEHKLDDNNLENLNASELNDEFTL